MQTNAMHRTAQETIIIVDRDEAVRDSFRCLLESVGFTVATYNEVEGFFDTAVEADAGCMLLELSVSSDRHGVVVQKVCDFAPRLLTIGMVYRQWSLSASVQRLPCMTMILERPIPELSLIQAIKDALGIAPKEALLN